MAFVRPKKCLQKAEPTKRLSRYARGPHLRPPRAATPGEIERRIRTKDVVRKFITSTGLDFTRTPFSAREFKLHMLLLNVGAGLDRQRKGDRRYTVPCDRPPWTEEREAPPPKRGRPPIVPALAIAIRELVDFVNPVNAALILLVTQSRQSSEFPLIDMRGLDGNVLIRRLANRLGRIAARQRSEDGYPEPRG